MSRIKPRHAAARMIRSFINGTPSEEALKDLAPALHDIAREHARSQAAMIVHHARIARTSPAHLQTIDNNLALVCRAYNQNQRKAQEAQK